MRNFIVLDTEGVDTVKRSATDGVHPETSLFYDLGFIVVDGNTGRILESHSFINSDVFFNTNLMTSAYYAEKLPLYYADMGEEWDVADTRTIWEALKAACRLYQVKDIWAYNDDYDRRITNNTIRHFSNGFVAFFTPYGTRWRDIWAYAGSTLCNTRKYVKWCISNGLVSEKGNPSTSADTVIKYVTNDMCMDEEHTALSDCFIEWEILQTARRRHQKARHKSGHGWRYASQIAKTLREDD